MGLPQKELSHLTYHGSQNTEQKGKKQNFAGFLWDTFNKPPEERKLLFKVDTALLTFSSFGSSL